MNLNEITLRNLPPPHKSLAAWALVILALGYAHGLLYVLHTTDITPRGVEQQYRGNQTPNAAGGDTQGEMKFSKSYQEMLTIIHTHIVGMATMFFVSGFIFAFSSLAQGAWKKFLLVEPFAAIATSFAAMWLMWAVHPLFSWLLMLSSGSMAVAFYITVYYSLRELAMKPAAGREGDER